MSGNEAPATATAPAPVPAPAATPWGEPSTEWKIGDKPWYETALPEGPARALMADKKYANPVALANAYHELNRTASHINADNTLVIPGENATPEDWTRFYTKLGRPADIEGYKDVKWGENADPRMVEFGKNLAFKLGLSPKAVEGIMATEWNTFVTKLNGDSAAEEARTNEATIATLKTEWKGGDFDANLASGKRVMTALKNNGMSEDDFIAIEGAIGAAPVVKLLATIGKLTGEASFMSGNQLGGLGGDINAMTPDQAAAEITRLGGDKDFQKTYLGKNEPGHKEAAERMANLYAKAGDKVQL